MCIVQSEFSNLLFTTSSTSSTFQSILVRFWISNSIDKILYGYGSMCVDQTSKPKLYKRWLKICFTTLIIATESFHFILLHVHKRDAVIISAAA